MGAVCCCFPVTDIDGHEDENDSNHGNCLFIDCCIQSIRNKYGALCARGSGLPVPTSNQEATSSDPLVPNNSSFIARSCDRTLQMNPNSGYSPVMQDVVVQRQDKGSNYARVEPEPDLSSSTRKGVSYDVPLSEDEDVCPTCLEEYTQENPKIITQCFHHYHLSCIYEWMERSETCPVCGTLMAFNET